MEENVRRYDKLDEVATYGLPEASRYLRIPEAKTRRWIQALDAPVVDHLISFTTLLELHVLKSIRLQDVPFQRIRSALVTLARRVPGGHPLLEKQFLTNGLDIFLEEDDDLINLSRYGQQAFKSLVEVYLQRIEWKELGPRLYPFITNTSQSEPRSIAIDPRLSFGKPVIASTGISTAVIAGRFMARDPIVELADEYRVAPQMIEDAIRWELPHLNAA